MSRIGKKPIVLENGARVEQKGSIVYIEGPHGVLSLEVDQDIKVQVEEGYVTLSNSGGKNKAAKFGLYRAMIQNMVIGVTQKYTEELDIIGVGYRVQLQGKDLVFSLGYSHPVVVSPPEGAVFLVEGQNKVKVVGIDKQLVGQVASNLRDLRPPDAYKGKGVKYSLEVIKKKQGKSVKK